LYFSTSFLPNFYFVFTYNLRYWSNHMSVDVDPSQDLETINDVSIEAEDDVSPKLTGKEASQHTLEMRRKLEDRLERKRIKEQLGYDGLSDLSF
jgi:hypothetical protein